MRAFALACVAGLVRPEAWPFIVLAGLWAVRERRSRRAVVLAVALAVPLAWVLPEWAGSGSPLGGQGRVLHSPGAFAAQASAEPWLLVLVRFRDLVGRWLLWTALAGAMLELRARRPQCALVLAGAALWVAVVAAMAQFGYPGLARFMIPAALAVCVVAGVAVARGLRALEARGPLLAVVAAVLVGVWLLPVVDRGIPNLRRQQVQAEAAVHEQSDLAAVVHRAGGPASVLGCGAPRTWWAAEPLVHWMLDQTEVRPHRGGVVLIRERRRDRRGFVPRAPTRTRLRLLASGRLWEVQGRCDRN
jgi:hypothetical protein